MANMYVSYKIETLVEGIVRPGDELKGKVFVRNEEKKEQKLKYVGAYVMEHCMDKRYNETLEETRDEDVGQLLKKVDIFKGGKIAPGETMEFDFAIKLPSFPGRRYRDWHVSIDFVQKTGLFASSGKDIEDAKCVLPVPGSNRMPTIGNLQ